MTYLHLFFVSVLLVAFQSPTLACKGCVSLDEHNFAKIVTRFKAVLVKFDVAYPYGEKHDVFTKLAEEITGNDDIVLAEVGVKDYGEKENDELAKRYGVNGKDDLPAVKLFLASADNPVSFSDDFTIDNLRNLIRDHTDLYLGLPGCLEVYDKAAMEFVSSKNKEQKLKDIEDMSATAKEEEKTTIKIYLLYMRKVVEQGVAFVKQEISRLSKITKEGKVNAKKKEELSQRLNILHSFKLVKDEL